MKPLDDDVRSLAEEFLPTALAIGEAFAFHHPGWLDDLRGAAQLGLCHAARTFDGSCPWPIWAAFHVRCHLRRELARLRDFPGDAGDDGDLDAIPDGDGTAAEVASLREEAALLGLALRRLSPIEAWVLCERYGIAAPADDETPLSASPTRRPTRDGRAYFHRTLTDLARECGISVGHWDWTALRWGPFGPGCLLPFQAVPDDLPGGSLFCRPQLPDLAVPYLLERVALDPAGNPIETIATETVEPG